MAQSPGNAKPAYNDLLFLLPHELTGITDPLPSGVEVKFRLVRNNSERLLMTGPKEMSELTGKKKDASGNEIDATKWTRKTDRTYKLKIKQLFLLVKQVVVSERLFTHHQKLLAQNKPIRYYYNRLTSTELIIPAGLTEFLSTPIFSASEYTPQSVFGVFFTQKRLGGDLTENIQKYMLPSNLCSIQLLNNMRPIGNFCTPGSTTFATGELLKHYTSLFMNCGAFFDPTKDLAIDFEQFKEYRFVFTANLSTAGIVGDNQVALPLLRDGELRMCFKFTTPLAAPMKMILFGASTALLTCDSNRLFTQSYRV